MSNTGPLVSLRKKTNTSRFTYRSNGRKSFCPYKKPSRRLFFAINILVSINTLFFQTYHKIIVTHFRFFQMAASNNEEIMSHDPEGAITIMRYIAKTSVGHYIAWEALDAQWDTM